jgi:hypothetical protein
VPCAGGDDDVLGYSEDAARAGQDAVAGVSAEALALAHAFGGMHPDRADRADRAARPGAVGALVGPTGPVCDPAFILFFGNQCLLVFLLVGCFFFISCVALLQFQIMYALVFVFSVLELFTTCCLIFSPRVLRYFCMTTRHAGRASQCGAGFCGPRPRRQTLARRGMCHWVPSLPPLASPRTASRSTHVISCQRSLFFFLCFFFFFFSLLDTLTPVFGFCVVQASRGMDEGESGFAVEVPVPEQPHHMNDKFRPRKPRFFNRVKVTNTLRRHRCELGGGCPRSLRPSSPPSPLSTIARVCPFFLV